MDSLDIDWKKSKDEVNKVIRKLDASLVKFKPPKTPIEYKYQQKYAEDEESQEKTQPIAEIKEGKHNKRIFGYFTKIFEDTTLGTYILSDNLRAVLTLAVIGFFISNQYKLTMNSDTWFWFFSSIAQTFAALVALVAIFIISRLELYNVKLNNSKETIQTFIKSTLIEEKQDLVEYDGWLEKNINRILLTPEPTYREKNNKNRT